MERRIDAETLRSIRANIIAERQEQAKDRNACEHCVVPTACLHCRDKPETKKIPAELQKAWEVEDKEAYEEGQRRKRADERTQKHLDEARRRAKGQSPIY